MNQQEIPAINSEGQCEECCAFFEGSKEGDQCPNVQCYKQKDPGHAAADKSQPDTPSEVLEVLSQAAKINPRIDHVLFTCPDGKWVFLSGLDVDNSGIDQIDNDLLCKAANSVPQLPYAASL